MLLRINPESPAPLFEQVAAAVRAQIAQGDVRPGDRLPPARDVAQGLGVNLHTVLHAYQDLRDEGLIELRRGRGAVVTDAAGAVAQLQRDIAELGRRAAALGVAPSTAVAMLRASM
ncbi:GntR family transcriptional regulator [Demequina sp.]|uniref:GntR family transcriptional regulator n=1 Tax=Demequina sp. TaxID=2050685 RepID=UPI003D132352